MNVNNCKLSFFPASVSPRLHLSYCRDAPSVTGSPLVPYNLSLYPLSAQYFFRLLIVLYRLFYLFIPSIFLLSAPPLNCIPS